MSPQVFRLRPPGMTPVRHRKPSDPLPFPRGPKYVPPAADRVRVLTAAELLRGARPLAAQAQQLDLANVAMHTPLWVAGDIDLLQQHSVAIVGTRKVSPEGAARARRLAKELAEANIVVVSGLAKGVDTEALTAAIEAGGRVAAVIGTPIDAAYPAENKRLQETIYERHLLISQFPPGKRVFPANFPERNRMMATLTDASVIIEAGETSGTLHQAAECVRLGRWLFIAKNVADDPSLTWPTRFMANPRVRVLTKTEDILAVL